MHFTRHISSRILQPRHSALVVSSTTTTSRTSSYYYFYPRRAIIDLRQSLSSAAATTSTTTITSSDNHNTNNNNNNNHNNATTNVVSAHGSLFKHQEDNVINRKINNDTRHIDHNIQGAGSAAGAGVTKPSDYLYCRNSLDQEIMESIQNCNCGITLEELRRLASQPCTPLSLSDMNKYACANANSVNYGPQRLRNAQFLHKELPIRVAQRAMDLLTLPHGLNKTKQVQEVTHNYLRYLRKLIDLPCPTTEEEEFQFTDCLREIVQDRKTIPMTIAQGVSSLLQEQQQQHHEELDSRRLQEMEKALYRFFNARIGLRLLAEHHILSCVKRQKENEEYRMKHGCFGGPDNDDDVKNDTDNNRNCESYLGCIQYDCNPYIEARRVANKVMKHCKECYGITPEIEVLDCTPEKYADSKFTYVPHHLQYTLAELLKNSCRATITRHAQGKIAREDHVGTHHHHHYHHHHDQGAATDESLPCVRVVIAKGAEDVTIKVADRGGGVSRSVLDKMWSFAHSNTSDEIQSRENDTSFETDEFSGGKIRGFGLPLARIYARYFGGELTLKSMEGYGVDAYLYLPMLGKGCENLPKRVLQSPGNLDSVHDGNHHVYYGDPYSSAHFKTQY